MTPNEGAAVIGGVIATLTAVYSVIRFMIKGILYELTPNNGTSLKDQVSRIEARLDQLILELATRER